MSIPPDANIEPTREVLRIIYMGFGSHSLSNFEPKLLQRAHELVRQGWLVEGASYPCLGRQYTQFKASERLDLRELKHL